MKKFASFLLLVVLIIIAFLYATVRSGSPTNAVSDFYDSLIADRDGYLGNGEYKNFGILSDGFISKVDNAIQGFDPFFCAQDKPESLKASLVERTATTSVVSITEKFGDSKKTLSVNLERGLKGWQIVDIKCGGGGVPESGDLNIVGDYIKENVSSLAPVKEQLGGKFFITSINFKDGGGIMNYEDGHNAYSATFKYSVDSSNKVTISDVALIADTAPLGSNFTKIGNITKLENAVNWTLVYEEPGKPALTKELIVKDDSLCISGQDISYCYSFVITAGDRVLIDGKENEGKIEVLRMVKK